MEKINYNEFDEMVKAAEKRGFQVYTGKGKYADYTGWLGIETKSFQVYWFKIIDGDLLIFDNVYNCNNGKTSRGFKRGFNFRWKMYLKEISEREVDLRLEREYNERQAARINRLNS